MVLVVEDDPGLARVIAAAITGDGHEVHHAATGHQALAMAELHVPQVIVLDLGLPDLDGLEVLRQLRADGVRAGVLVLTARGAVHDRVAGLRSGADDYLGKPFAVGELLARMRALARRSAGASSSTLANGVVSLELATKLAVTATGSHNLSHREFALLQALMLRPGAVLSRAQLEQSIYGWGEEVESNAVDVIIHGLRRKLGADCIRNVRGLGWRVVCA
jgi:two-component system OmpR family response regulator